MSLIEKGQGGDPALTFTLIDKTPGSDLKFVIQASDEATRKEWFTQIQSVLNMQSDFLRGNLFKTIEFLKI